jgi:hypothetical protein
MRVAEQAGWEEGQMLKQSEADGQIAGGSIRVHSLQYAQKK